MRDDEADTRERDPAGLGAYEESGWGGDVEGALGLLAWTVSWLESHQSGWEIEEGQSGEKGESGLLCGVQEAVGRWGLSGSLEGSGHGQGWAAGSSLALQQGVGVGVQAQGLRQAWGIAGRVGKGLRRGAEAQGEGGSAREVQRSPGLGH